MIINGKEYPLWSQFVENKNEFIDKILQDRYDYIRRIDKNGNFEDASFKTKIKDIKLEPNGKNSAFFSIVGEDFTCGFDVRYGGIITGDEGYITFSGYGGHTFRIKVK